MLTQERLLELFDPVFQKYHIKLYEIVWKGPNNNKTLEVSIMHEDGSMDLDTCALVSEELSQILDENDSGNMAYTLDVCSPGAEREVKDFNELKTIPNPYIFVRLKKSIDKKNEFTGEVIEINDLELTLKYRAKEKEKTVTIPLEQIEKTRFAVRI